MKKLFWISSLTVALLISAFTLRPTVFALGNTANTQDRDEMNGVTVTGTVKNGEDSNMTDIGAVVKNNNGVTVKNVQFEVRYSCDSKEFTANKTIDYLPANYSTDRWLETCARMISSGRPEGRIIRVRVINVD